MIFQLSNSPPLSTSMYCSALYYTCTVHVLPRVRLWGAGALFSDAVFSSSPTRTSYSFAPHRTCLVSPAVLAKQQCSQVCRVLSHRRWRSSLVLYVQLLDFECSRGGYPLSSTDRELVLVLKHVRLSLTEIQTLSAILVSGPQIHYSI
jgi:hypothetical protein